MFKKLQEINERELLLVLEALAKPDQLPLCINIKWAQPLIEYVLKEGYDG